MSLCKARPLAARLAHLDVEQTPCGELAHEHPSSPTPGDDETFRLSVQFALAHGVQPTVRRSEITTLSSSTLLSGASAR